MKLSCFTSFAIKTYPNHTEDKYPKEHTLAHCFVIRDGFQAQNSIECKYYALVSFPKKTKLPIKANKFRKTIQLFLMKHTILSRSLGLFITFSANCSKPSIWLLLIVIFFLLVGYRSSPVESHCSHLISDIAPDLSKVFLDIQATIDCRFTLKYVRDMIRTYNQMHRTDKYLQHSSINWSVWLNVRVFI